MSMKGFTKAAIAVLFLSAYLCLQLFSHPVSAQQQLSPEGIEFFEKKIRPVLESNCYGCHSANSKRLQGGLRLDTRDGILNGGNSGQPSITAGDPENSLLINAIRYKDSKLQMPPTGQLSAEQIKDFEAWVKMGAPDPRWQNASGKPPTSNLEEARNFWAFQRHSTPHDQKGQDHGGQR